VVIKYWCGIKGESVYDKYLRFLNEEVQECVDIYVHCKYRISNEVEMLGNESMFIKLLPRKSNLILDMLVRNNGVTSKELCTCDPTLFIIRNNIAKRFARLVLAFDGHLRVANLAEDDDAKHLAYVGQLLIKGVNDGLAETGT